MEYLLGATDLGISKVVARQRMTTGKTYKIKARVQNHESCFSKEVEVSFYLSRNKTLNKDKDHMFGTSVVPGIKGRGSKLIILKAKIPTGFKTGVHYVIAEIGAGESFMEINTENNKRLKRVLVK